MTVRHEISRIRLPTVRPAALFEDSVALSAQMTILILLLYTVDYWYVSTPASVLALSALFFSDLAAKSAFWLIAASLVLGADIANWYEVDNHQFLLGYWLLAFAFCLGTHEPKRALALAARWLIGLVFLLAVIWKASTPDYLNSMFFQYELLLDDRFAFLAGLLAGIPEPIEAFNEAARAALTNYDSELEFVLLRSAPGIGPIASLITWWTILIELIIGIAFLAPSSSGLFRLRNILLLIFIYTTYFFAPVIGFGWLLATMGVAQTERTESVPRLLYVIGLIVLQAYRLPLSRLADLI